MDGNNAVGACGGNLFDANCLPTQSFTRIFPGIIWELNYITLNIFPKLFMERIFILIIQVKILKWQESLEQI